MTAAPHNRTTPSVVLATYAESETELTHIGCMIESLRTFGGRFSGAPVWVYMSEALHETEGLNWSSGRTDLEVELRTSRTPADAEWFYYSGKTFAAGEAERAARGRYDLLIWLDEDTIFLQEPEELALDETVAFAYRPVMHNRSGSLASEAPDPFWNRIYDLLELDPNQLFTMVTPADRQTIRAYFNAGLLAVRPERNLLTGWGEAFKTLYRDPQLAAVCRDETTWRIFLHQAALVAPVLTILDQSQTRELPDAYNYPMFFKKMYGAATEFDDLTGIVTLRYDIYFKDPDPNWYDLLKGPADRLAWLKDRLTTQE